MSSATASTSRSASGSKTLSRRFFALPEATKARFAMPLGGRAWRGWFPLGGELTSGRPDWKEGLYLGTELGEEHPRVAPGVPLHGRNLFPGDDVLPGLRQTVLEWMAEVTALGHRVMQGIAGSLDLPADYFAQPLHRRPADPLSHLPLPEPADARRARRAATASASTPTTACSRCCARTVGGLQVHTTQGWIEAPPVPQSFVCNIGDMLDRMTGGLYRSTPHRVRLNTSGRDRLSFPLFFDPDFDARIEPIRSAATDDHATRWDGASVHAFEGTLWRLPARQGRQGVPGAAARGAVARRSSRSSVHADCLYRNAILFVPMS